MTRSAMTLFAALGLIGLGAGDAGAQTLRLAGTECTTPPVLHCPDSGCSGPIVTSGGPAVEAKTGRNYFLAIHAISSAETTSPSS